MRFTQLKALASALKILHHRVSRCWNPAQLMFLCQSSKKKMNRSRKSSLKSQDRFFLKPPSNTNHATNIMMRFDCPSMITRLCRADHFRPHEKPHLGWSQSNLRTAGLAGVLEPLSLQRLNYRLLQRSGGC